MKKFIFILFLFVFLSLSVSCKKELEINDINDYDIFNCEEETYYIYIYKDGCSICESTLPSIIKYYNKNNDVKFYKLNIHKEDEEASIIAREFTLGETGNQPTGVYVNGCTDYEQLFIKGTPMLIKIETIDEKKQSIFIAYGKSEINSFLNGEASEEI